MVLKGLFQSPAVMGPVIVQHQDTLLLVPGVLQISNQLEEEALHLLGVSSRS